jgi:predicted transcriptional regulator
MTKLLEKALEAVRRLSPEEQDEIARTLLQLVGDDAGGPEAVATEHLAAVLEGLAQAQRGDFASDAEVEAAFRRFDR